MAGMTDSSSSASAVPRDGVRPEVPHPPVAARRPHRRSVHGDVFDDLYEWMRDKDSPELRDYVAAENRYCEERTAHLAGLRRTLFDELKSHVQETDMSVPVRVDGYWYFSRTIEGRQYGVQCRVPVAGPDDWDPPRVAPGNPGSMPGEEVVFDANHEAVGHDFFRIGGMDVSRNGRLLLYGVDLHGDERYDYRLRDLSAGRDLSDVIDGIGGACLTPDGRWVFYAVLDDAWRPCAIRRHRVGTSSDDDVEVFREKDERFWVGVGLSFDERLLVIGTDSKTTTEVLTLPVDEPEGEFRAFIPRREGIEYDVGFSRFEGAGEDGKDIPVAVVCHNALNPNFEVDVIDMRSHEPPYRLGEGARVAVGSPYGCEKGDDVLPGASERPIGTPWSDPSNPEILQCAQGLEIEGLGIHRHAITLSWRAGGMGHIAVMPKDQAARDFLAGRPWRFREVVPPSFGGETHDERLYSVGLGGNPSYDAPRLRYSFSSYTRPGELHEIDPATGRDVLLKRAKVLGGFDPADYAERRLWVTSRDGESIPVSLVWRRDRLPQGHRPDGGPAPMFITGYGAYEISSDPGFSSARLSLLDRGVLYAVAHVRGGGEMGRAWYEQGRRLAKKHTFEDFVDVTAALQRMGLSAPATTVANGGSAGGLLMGAVANMAPELYAGIEADVPFVDALTSILDPSLPLTGTAWDERGTSPHDPAGLLPIHS